MRVVYQAKLYEKAAPAPFLLYLASSDDFPSVVDARARLALFLQGSNSYNARAVRKQLEESEFRGILAYERAIVDGKVCEVYTFDSLYAGDGCIASGSLTILVPSYRLAIIARRSRTLSTRSMIVYRLRRIADLGELLFLLKSRPLLATAGGFRLTHALWALAEEALCP